jgi:polyhydroxybutyrate depolymerase
MLSPTSRDRSGSAGGSRGKSISGFWSSLPAFLGGPTASERKAEALGIRKRVVRIGFWRRYYYFYVPPGLSPEVRPPLVIGLHGGAGNALAFSQHTGLREMADHYGMVVAAPQAWGWWWSRWGTWNADSTTRLGLAERLEFDDLCFLDAVIGSMEAETGTDPARVFAMGVSKGGMMAYRMACAMPDRIAAIAVVAGTLSTDHCPEGAAVPLVHIHGSRDENVPLEGGRGRYSARGADWPPVMAGIDLFRRANGCAPDPEIVRVAPDTVCRIWRSPDGAEVQLCLVEGGGHAWPGALATPRQTRRCVYVSPHFGATDHIARFFRDR